MYSLLTTLLTQYHHRQQAITMTRTTHLIILTVILAFTVARDAKKMGRVKHMF